MKKQLVITGIILAGFLVAAFVFPQHSAILLGAALGISASDLHKAYKEYKANK